ncbi:hypothetical protein K2173_020673 [Erythroxylum novogranatense]|uniref:GAG-pre-integrase domain-containing protein n=1 Tax=Erythroxylum novogranatense TaxID=1862640 RepID=A0AAV8TPH0_9ROSI|nr:hypothetical protein K2173_020673 [Erythroxylum novogranatense]
MKALNLIREFELQRMKESETAKEYSKRLLDIVNKVRLLATSFDDFRIVQRILGTTPENYEASIAALENTRDLSTITLSELLNSFQAQEQRRSMRHNGFVEGALLVRHHEEKDFQKKQTGLKDEQTSVDRNRGKGGSSKEYPPWKHCGKTGHPPYKCWRRPDAQCKKCNQLGHETVICKNKNQEVDAQVADQDEEDQIFVATCFSTRCSFESWLIDSGCTNHMTYDKTLFKELNLTEITKVNWKWCLHSSKRKGSHCNYNNQVLRVEMRGKSFSFNPTEEKHTVFFVETSITEIWHKRLGHCHFQCMLETKKKDMIRDLPMLADHLPNRYMPVSLVNKPNCPFQSQLGEPHKSRN